MTHDGAMSDDTNQETSMGASATAAANQVIESAQTVAGSVASGVQATASQAAMGAAATAAGAAADARRITADAMASAAATANQTAESAQSAASQAAFGAQATVETGSESVKASAGTLVDELTKLGAQVTASAKNALDSPQMKEAQTNVTSALSGLALSIEEHVKKLAEREDVKRAVQQVETGADTTLESIATNKTVQDVAAGIMKGLGSAASQLTTWLNQQSASQPQSGGGFGGPETDRQADNVEEIKVEKQE